MKIYKFDCESCGSKQYIKTKNGYKCKYCGAVQDVISEEDENREDKIVQAEIVTKVNEHKYKEMNQSTKNALIKLLICIFAGVYGIHKFMEHKIFSGIIYFFTFGLFGIGWFFDVVKYVINLSVEWKRSGGEQ